LFGCSKFEIQHFGKTAKSLLLAKNSLIYAWKFPVPSGREFGHKPLKSRAD